MRTILFSTLLAWATCASLPLHAQPGPPFSGTWVLRNLKDVPVPPPEIDTETELAEVRGAVSQVDEGTLNGIRYWDAGAPAYRWMQLASQEVLAHNLGGPLSTRAMALVAAAISDATAAAAARQTEYASERPADVDPGIVPLVVPPVTKPYPSEYAATAGAAAAVLKYLFPDRESVFDNLAREAAGSRVQAGVEFPSDSAAGLLLGTAAGELAVAYARNDGSAAPFTGSFPPGPGTWSGANPAQPLAGTWKPWVLESAAQFRPGPPPPYNGPEMAMQVDMVKSRDRAVAPSQIAWLWEPSVIAPWLDIINREIFEQKLETDAVGAARVYALTMVAGHDASVACWDAKYTYLEMRPVMFDSSITTLFPTPNHPSYPSGHACASGAYGAVLSALFPGDAPAFEATARQAGLSTFYAGVHFALDVDAGQALGKSVGDAVVKGRAEQMGAPSGRGSRDKIK